MTKILTLDDVKRDEEKLRNRKYPIQIVKLPCGHMSVEIDKPEDKYIQCKYCAKKFVLTWSKIKPKLEWEA